MTRDRNDAFCDGFDYQILQVPLVFTWFLKSDKVSCKKTPFLPAASTILLVFSISFHLEDSISPFPYKECRSMCVLYNHISSKHTSSIQPPFPNPILHCVLLDSMPKKWTCKVNTMQIRQKKQEYIGSSQSNIES